MSKPNKTIERPLRSMLVSRNTYSMSIEEFINRLADFLVASFEEEFLADVPPDDTRKIEFERHREFELETHRVLTIKSLTKTLANRILAGDITFEHPVTKGRLFVKKFDKDGERVVRDYKAPMSQLQKFALEEYGVEIAGGMSSPSKDQKQQSKLSARQARKEKTAERNRSMIAKGLEIKCRNSKLEVTVIAIHVKREMGLDLSLKSIRNILYDSGQFPT